MLSLCVCVKLLYVKFLCVGGGGRREEAEELVYVKFVREVIVC